MRIGQAVVALAAVGLLSACTITTGVDTTGPTAGPVNPTAVQTDVGVPPQQQPQQPQPQQQSGPRKVSAVSQAGGLVKVTGQEAVSDLVIDPGEVRPDMTLVMENYRAPGQQGEPVLVVAVDNVPEDTSTRREHLWRGMLERIGWTAGASAEPFEPGPLGGSVECLLASLDADGGDVICGWADESTAGIAYFPSSTLQTAASTFVAMRGDIER